MKNYIIGALIAVLVIVWIGWSNKQTDKAMEIQYCWDSQGNHYVAPSEQCRQNLYVSTEQ